MQPGKLTEEKIPTLEEALLKGKVYYNLDVVNKNVAVSTLVSLLKKHDMENAALVYVSNNRNYASVGSYDANMLSENYSGLVSMINKRINVVQTDYPENAARYLKSKGYR